MNSNKISLILCKVFNIVFFVVFSLLFFQVVFWGYERGAVPNTYNCDFIQHLGIIICAAAITVVFVFVYRELTNPRLLKRPRKLPDVRVIIFASMLLMLILQFFAAYMLYSKPLTDANCIHQYASDYAVKGDFSKIQSEYLKGRDYFPRYPNNLAALFITSFVYRITYLLTGEVSRVPLVVLNTLSINISALLTVLLARKIYGNRKSMFVLMLCMLFAPFYTYTCYCYSDSLSLPYAIGSVYLYVCACDIQNKKKKYLLLALCGALIYIGFKIKGSVVIVFAVLFVYTFLRNRLKQTLCIVLALTVGFGCVSAVYTTAVKSSNIITEEQSYNSEYPFTHWAMMGLKGLGHFNSADNKFTEAIKGKDEKTEANIREIKNRLDKLGADGMIEHLSKKAVWTWEDGTYFISWHISKPLRRGMLQEFVLNDGSNHYVFFAYSCGFQIFLILMMALSAFKGIMRQSCGRSLILRGCVMGIFLFLLVWETRSRYLYNFTPFFLLLAADGVDCLCKIAREFFSLFKLKGRQS